jgi:hypothetical protein
MRQISSLLLLISAWTIFTFYSTYTLTPSIQPGNLKNLIYANYLQKVLELTLGPQEGLN